MRDGAMAPVIAFLLPVIAILIGYSINIAFMELTATELRLSCDSAAKAALVNLGSTQSQSSAISFGQSVAANNTVGGQVVSIPNANFLFGNATKQSNGSYQFVSGASPFNSVQVTGASTVSYPFISLGSNGSYTCTRVSTATRIAHDIMLVLDRSASMAFDLSGNEYNYPSDRSTYQLTQSYFSPPSPTGSRWNALNQAVNSFVTVLESRNLDVHVGVVTYAENYSFGVYTATEASLDVSLNSNYGGVLTAMNVWGQTPLLGDTNISAGLILAANELTGADSRTTADRTIILFTDGVATTGNTDIQDLVLSLRLNESIVTHVITFGGEAASGSIQTSMMNSAVNGNGAFFNAATPSQLQTGFQTIADSLPAVFIE
jgi:hypothetical protein